jgi:hypothetical protein
MSRVDKISLELRYALFWEITLRIAVILYRRFGITCRAHLIVRDPWKWYHYTLHNFPDELRSRLFHNRSLNSLELIDSHDVHSAWYAFGCYINTIKFLFTNVDSMALFVTKNEPQHSFLIYKYIIQHLCSIKVMCTRLWKHKIWNRSEMVLIFWKYYWTLSSCLHMQISKH